MRKRLPLIFLIVAIAIVGGGWYVLTKKSTTATTYQTSTVTKGTLVVSVSATGQLDSNNRVAASTSLTGTVDKVYVKNGDTVKSGQALIHIALDQTSQLALAKAQASLLSSQGAVTQAQQGITQAQQQKVSLHQALLQAENARAQAQTDYTNAVNNSATTSDVITQKSNALSSANDGLTIAKSKYASADTSITQAKQSLTQAQANLSISQQSASQITGTVSAPVAGTVNDMTLVTGQILSGSSSSSSSNSAGNSSSTQIATIVTNSLPTATFSLAEADVVNVKTGQQVTIAFDSLTSQSFTGTVVGINQSGTVSSGVTTYPMVVQLDAQNASLLPNMSATANVITSTEDNVLMVPSAAVKSSGSSTYVQVMQNGKPSNVTVTAGASNATQTIISSGLTEGQTVVTATITPTTNTNSSSTGSLFGGITGSSSRSTGAATRSFTGGAPGGL